jgi:hypothetical protein
LRQFLHIDPVEAADLLPESTTMVVLGQ